MNKLLLSDFVSVLPLGAELNIAVDGIIFCFKNMGNNFFVDGDLYLYDTQKNIAFITDIFLHSDYTNAKKEKRIFEALTSSR